MDRNLEIVRLLADGELHSGEAIAARLGISRAAVWKAVRKAADVLDLNLDSVRGHGYRLRTPLELLDADAIHADLPAPTRSRISAIDVLAVVDSTNSWLMQRARDGAPSGSVCLAEQQTAGRGRLGRAWLSPFGANVYLSLLWRYPLAPAQLGGLSLAAGVAVARALTRRRGVRDRPEMAERPALAPTQARWSAAGSGRRVPGTESRGGGGGRQPAARPGMGRRHRPTLDRSEHGARGRRVSPQRGRGSLIAELCAALDATASKDWPRFGLIGSGSTPISANRWNWWPVTGASPASMRASTPPEPCCWT